MSPITQACYTTSEDAENAFYTALQAGNLEALMQVWAEDDEVVCVHPNGQRVVGHAAIRLNWQDIFAGNRRLQITVNRSVRWSSMLMSIHSVVEHISIGGEEGQLTLAATNVYVRGATGWRILIHHSSAIQEGAEGMQDALDNQPHTLH